MRVAIGRAHTGLSYQETIAAIRQAFPVAETTLIESSVRVTQLTWELNVSGEVFEL